MLLSVLVVVAGVAFPMSSAWTASDFDKFRGRVGRSAQDGPPLDLTPNVVCVCKDVSNPNRAGALISFPDPAGGGINTLRVTCAVLSFDASSGGFAFGSLCERWELLPK